MHGGFTAEGEVRLSGAEVGGVLNCEGGHFTNAKGFALNAQGAKVSGSVFLRDGFTIEGEFILMSAEIGGQLNCEGGHFANADGYALNAQKLLVGDMLWRNVKAVSGTVDLSGAQIGDLVDDTESWDMADDLHLNGFTYEHIHGPVDAKMRLDWVAKGAVIEGEFMPQPYEQLAKVLRGMGHVATAREVLYEKEKCLSRARLSRVRSQSHDWLRGLKIAALWIWDRALRWGVGYGFYPLRSVGLLLGLLIVATGLFHMAYTKGDFAPNAAVILVSKDWQALAEDGSVTNPAEKWTSKTGKGRDYETFSAIAYAADVVIPIIPFGQEEAWAPSTSRGPWGYHAWYARWVLKMLGWIVTAFGAAAITGIIRKD